MLRLIKNKIFGDLSTDTALRYVPLVNFMKKHSLVDRKILESGSGDIGITPYLKTEVTGLDIAFENKKSDILKKVKYDGSSFPFDDNEFDVCLSVDSLEHVPRQNRPFHIKEMIRVSKEALIIVVPSGKEAEKHDFGLREYFKKVENREDKFLEEHIRNGLPNENEVLSLVKENLGNKKIKKIKVKKLTNLKIRHFLMISKIGKSKFLKIIYFIFLPLVLLGFSFSFGKCYRKIFFIKYV